MVNYSKENVRGNEGGGVFLRSKSAQHSSFGRDWLTSFHRDEEVDWKVFCRDGFSLNGRRNGSNRGIESRPNLGGCFERLY